MATDEATLDQVAQQCRIIAHLAKVLADVYGAHADLFADHHPGHSVLAEMVGKRTAELMEVLGEHLNGIDAVEDGAEWMEPIYREAQRRWPQHKSAA